MNPHHELDELLQCLGKPLPPESSLVDKVMDRLPNSPVFTPSNRKGLRIMKSSLGLSVSVLVLLAVWLLSLSAPELTLAELREAIGREHWLHVEFDTGDELWILLGEHQSWHRDRNGNAAYHDHRRNIHQQWRPQLHFIIEDHLPRTALGSPSSPLDAVGLPQEWLTTPNADLPTGNSPPWTRNTESVQGQQLIRFDFFGQNSLKQRVVKRQLWVDPQTKLPVRVRQRLLDGSYQDGRYSFPQSGPQSLADLGVPANLPVRIMSDVQPASEPELVQALKKIDEAIGRFPTRYRALIWGEEMQVFYQDGLPQWDESGFYWGPVKFCRLRYDASEVRLWDWFETPQPWNILLNDGQRRVDYNTRENRIRIGPRGRGNLIIPMDCFWPIGGTATRLNTPGKKDAGLIGIRFEGVNWRKDCWFDPAHDHIAVEQIDWTLDSDGWRRTEEHRLTDLRQLPGDRWYPAMRITTLHRPGLPEETIVTLFHIQPFQAKEPPLAQFDIDRLLQEARKQGATVSSD
ncbi:hypothetical protein Pan241w_46060 [Gimesia alba]|uniref:Uncharacterized protein n=1 Tax=Gimesia alba TaxID=2527973 RepID=A0A517RKS7_9PLAN|nr:hypothetical protein [Gimesia alba]QDT44496.1 hypothetical protein Pan241w_46060 [Gimesia alba]